MRKSHEEDIVICPDAPNLQPYHPEQVYDSKGPDGKYTKKGILPPHKKHEWHKEGDCDWTGHPVPVVQPSHPTSEGYMRKSHEEDRVICPDATNGQPYHPEQVYDSRGIDGKYTKKGILPPHKKHESGKEGDCDWTGHPVPVVQPSHPTSSPPPPIGFPL